MKPFRSAMKRILSVITLQLTGIPIYTETPFCYPIGKPARSFSGTRGIIKIILHIVIPQYNIRRHSRLVRHDNARDSCSK